MKKKNAAMLITAGLMTMVFSAQAMAASLEENKMELPKTGVTFNTDSGLADLDGSVLPYEHGNLMYSPDIYGLEIFYIPYSMEDLADENIVNDIWNQAVDIGLVFAADCDGETLAEQMVQFGVERDASEYEMIGDAGKFYFYYLPVIVEEFPDRFDDVFMEDYEKARIAFYEVLQNAEFAEPADPAKTIIGKTISFTTVDTDGNAITSEELFADNKITMINLWGSWCPNCIYEMEELADIHTRLREKDCGVVGVEMEYNEGGFEDGKALMAEKGTNYPNVRLPEKEDTLRSTSAYPTTYFVDSEGRILTFPIEGALVEQYEATVEELLKSLTAE